jgi:hypothetical protein
MKVIGEGTVYANVEVVVLKVAEVGREGLIKVRCISLYVGIAKPAFLRMRGEFPYLRETYSLAPRFR